MRKRFDPVLSLDDEIDRLGHPRVEPSWALANRKTAENPQVLWILNPPNLGSLAPLGGSGVAWPAPFLGQLEPIHRAKEGLFFMKLAIVLSVLWLAGHNL